MLSSDVYNNLFNDLDTTKKHLKHKKENLLIFGRIPSFVSLVIIKQIYATRENIVFYDHLWIKMRYPTRAYKYYLNIEQAQVHACM